jgi:hypothetical protein
VIVRPVEREEMTTESLLADGLGNGQKEDRMAKRRARPFIEVELGQTFCPDSRFPDSPGELKGERVEVTYTENDPVRGWTPSSFEFSHRRELIWGNQFDNLAEGLVQILGGDFSDFKASHVLVGHPECACGHMHVAVYRRWRLRWSRKGSATCLAFHGKSETEDQWKRRQERLGPISAEMRKHQAECRKEDADAEATVGAEPVITSIP